MKVKYVLLFCLGIIIAIAGFDIYLYADGVAGNSITQIIIRASKHYPIVPATIGFVMGALFFHFFDTTSEGDK